MFPASKHNNYNNDSAAETDCLYFISKITVIYHTPTIRWVSSSHLTVFRDYYIVISDFVTRQSTSSKPDFVQKTLFGSHHMYALSKMNNTLIVFLSWFWAIDWLLNQLPKPNMIDIHLLVLIMQSLVPWAPLHDRRGWAVMKAQVPPQVHSVICEGVVPYQATTDRPCLPELGLNLNL